MKTQFLPILGLAFTILVYVGGFFPAYFFAKRKLAQNRLNSFLVGILGLIFWILIVFSAVELSCHLWQSNSTLALIGGVFLMGLAPYLLTFFIIGRTRAPKVNPSETSQK